MHRHKCRGSWPYICGPLIIRFGSSISEISNVDDDHKSQHSKVQTDWRKKKKKKFLFGSPPNHNKTLGYSFISGMGPTSSKDPSHQSRTWLIGFCWWTHVDQTIRWYGGRRLLTPGPHTFSVMSVPLASALLIQTVDLIWHNRMECIVEMAVKVEKWSHSHMVPIAGHRLWALPFP